MSESVTIKDLARELGVHHTTVSRALQGSQRIAEPTRRRVLDLARKRQYWPNNIARSLRDGSNPTLGVLFPYATIPYYATLLDALDVEADRLGLHLQVHFHRCSVQQELEAMESLLRQRVEGVLFCPAAASSLEALRDVIPPTGKLPVVFLGQAPTGQALPGFLTACVGPDVRMGAVDLGRHLLERGHRRIAFLVPTTEAAPAEGNPRVLGLREVIGAVPGTSLSVIPVQVDRDESAGEGEFGRRGISARKSLLISRQLAEKLLQQSPLPTAVITQDEVTAHILLARLHAERVRVPEEVSVACFGGTYLSEFGMLPLTCVEQPFEQMAKAVMEIVSTSKAMDKVQERELRLIRPTFVSRDSVAWLRSQNTGEA